MTVFVSGMFDDAPLAALGTPVIRGSGPEHPGVSEVEVVGASESAVRTALEAQGAHILELLPSASQVELTVASSGRRWLRHLPSVIPGAVTVGVFEILRILAHLHG